MPVPPLVDVVFAPDELAVTPEELDDAGDPEVGVELDVGVELAAGPGSAMGPGAGVVIVLPAPTWTLLEIEEPIPEAVLEM